MFNFSTSLRKMNQWRCSRIAHSAKSFNLHRFTHSPWFSTIMIYDACIFFFFFFLSWIWIGSLWLDILLQTGCILNSWYCHKILVLVSIQVRITHASSWGSLVLIFLSPSWGNILLKKKSDSLVNVVWVRAFQVFEDECVGLFRIKRNYFFEYKIQCVKTWNAFFAFAHFHISHLDDKLVLVHI